MLDDPPTLSGRIRFGDFEVDLESHELRRSGRKLRLQEKSFRVLQVLLESPGRVVSRTELAAALWPSDHYVDVEHGLNTAVRRLREALGDSAGAARYVETLPRLGYRFIGTLEPAVDPAAEQPASRAVAGADAPPGERPPAGRGPSPRPRGRLRRSTLLVLAGVMLAVLAIPIVLAVLPRSGGRPDAGDTGLRPQPPGAADQIAELLARSRYLRNHKRFEEAGRFVAEALKLDPANAEAVAGLAMTRLTEGRDDEARELAQRALELDPATWEAHRVLGHVARARGDMPEAERHFRRSVEAGPHDYKSRNRLARHLLELGRFDEAEELILETRRLAPDDPDVQNIRIEHALRTGDYESAIRQGEIWMGVWKQQQLLETPAVQDFLGLAYVGARRVEDALARFRVIDPGDELRAALTLGYAGRTAEARAVLERYEREDPGPGADPGRSGAMAMAWITTGDLDRAFAHLDRQLAARWYPGWLNCPLFDRIRRDPRWPAFAERMAREFSREATGSPARENWLQAWPRPAGGAPSEPPTG